jgi:hypothetical protein
VSQAPPRRSILVAAAAAAVLAVGGCSTPKAPPPAAAPTFASRAAVTCAEEAYQAHDPNGGWQHPQQSYYAPADKVMPTDRDLQHLLVNDAAAIVRYRRDAPTSQREALRNWAGTKVSVVVMPSRADGAPQLEAFTSNRHLTCDGVDPDQLTVFADRRGVLQIIPHGGSG